MNSILNIHWSLSRLNGALLVSKYLKPDEESVREGQSSHLSITLQSTIDRFDTLQNIYKTGQNQIIEIFVESI